MRAWSWSAIDARYVLIPNCGLTVIPGLQIASHTCWFFSQGEPEILATLIDLVGYRLRWSDFNLCASSSWKVAIIVLNIGAKHLSDDICCGLWALLLIGRSSRPTISACQCIRRILPPKNHQSAIRGVLSCDLVSYSSAIHQFMTMRFYCWNRFIRFI